MNEIAAKAPGNIRWPAPEVLAWPAGAALVVIADLLFWRHAPGLGFFLFSAATGLAVMVLHGRRGPTRRVLRAAGIAVAGALPFIETPSWTGALSAMFGIAILALACGDQLPRRLVDLPGTLVRFGVLAPLRLIGDALSSAARLVEQGAGHSVAIGLLKWVVPLVLAGVFVLLFAAANPLIDGVILALKPDVLFDLLDPLRVIFWGFMLALIWPFLIPKVLAWNAAAVAKGPHLPRAESILFGRGAILRALIVFNAIFAVQSVLDLAYLWGGVQLPNGMSYADYAHRGAYPLVATALLAAVFVLLAMRPGGAAEQSPLIRRLVYLFIGQNVLLVVSSILRLDLYVEVYTLTELRVAAGIWMGLVATGLILILARIALRKTNRWLVATNLASLGLVLYLCSFLDISGFIARFNVEHSRELTGSGSGLDVGYLSSLGPSAIPALDYFLENAEARTDFVTLEARMARADLASGFMRRDRDWRGWTFRDQRLDDYLAATGYLAEFPPADRIGATTP